MANIYKARLATHVKEGNKIEIPVIFSPFNFCYRLPSYKVDENRNLRSWNKLKASYPKDLEGFNKAKITCIREAWKLTLDDVTKTDRVISPSKKDPYTILEIVTFYVGKPMEKKDLCGGVKYVPAKKASKAMRRAREKRMKEIIISTAGKRRYIGKDVGMAADYFLERKPAEVAAVS